MRVDKGRGGDSRWYSFGAAGRKAGVEKVEVRCDAGMGRGVMRLGALRYDTVWCDGMRGDRMRGDVMCGGVMK